MPDSQVRINLTELIHRTRNGDEQALNSFFDITYADLHRLARARLRRAEPVTGLDTTSLVHESYLRFSKAGSLRLEDRAHFLRYAGHVMRSVIVDCVRKRRAERRGGGLARVTLRTYNFSHEDDDLSGEDEILRVHEALEEIASHDKRIVQVVEMRYFGGLTEVEIGKALSVTERTVRRDWEKARLLLAAALQ